MNRLTKKGSAKNWALIGCISVLGLCLVIALVIATANQVGRTVGVPPAWTPTLPSAAIATPAPTISAIGPAPAGMTPAQVVRIVDGDTIEVLIDGQKYTVRYIGVDTPETVKPNTPVQPFGPEASAVNEQLVAGKTVFLEKDVSETDRYRRLLRYVWVGDQMVNAELVRLGYAQVSTFPPDVKYEQLFLELQRAAKEAGRGLWGLATTEPSPTDQPAVQATAGSGAAASACPGGCIEPPDPACNIKGNVTPRSGTRIYHTPASSSYGNTQVRPEEGDRWFCTPQEAEAAGFRAPKN